MAHRNLKKSCLTKSVTSTQKLEFAKIFLSGYLGYRDVVEIYYGGSKNATFIVIA